jgi:phage RecT family recombinase
MAMTTQPERREITTKDLPALITSSKDAQHTIAPFLPEGVSLERVAASLRIALAKDRAAWKKEGLSPLERCSAMSVFMAVAKIAQWGLEIGETAHLVPFGTDCTPVADYKGLAQLVIGSGLVRHVEARCVYEKEPFTMTLGTTTTIEHRPIWSATDRGKMVGAYAIFDLRGGRSSVKYMGVEEIEKIRQQYSKQWKQGALPAWYAEKTVVRAGVKLLPKDPRLAKTLAAFEQIEAAEIPLEVPEALRELASGTASPTLPDERPRALMNAGEDGYGPGITTPTPPAQFTDDPGARAEDFEDRTAIDG